MTVSRATTFKRRTLTKGVAWAVPAVLASAAVPAFAASRCQTAEGHGFARSSRWAIANPATGALASPASNGPAVINGKEYWISQTTALGDEKAVITLTTSYLASDDGEGELKPGCKYTFRYFVVASDTNHGGRKGDVKLDIQLRNPSGVLVRNTGHSYTTKSGQNTNKTTSVPFNTEVAARGVNFTAREGLYHLEITITVAAEGNRREKVAARGIGITSPYFEFSG
ncbi:MULTISPECIES: hypothetical protein [Rothia]|uniref:Uncharacterized protein n=3 Tax=Rothia aeria TaxID=172042 RepID=A0A7Z9A306_9MICC|nr:MULTISPECIES: hypothetical protein [Rothia]EID51917.1 hypothetical protein HMPREF1324_0731 [Rothia aeria F0474]MDK7677949.1 hypothetical protein [Rothia aeria]MDO4883711.1 hypothetical protein [Rothia sp. (in: high G+C Gram-positive bacteria)]VEI22949.1 Uncharacterised protein [Rothia aeria]